MGSFTFLQPCTSLSVQLQATFPFAHRFTFVSVFKQTDVFLHFVLCASETKLELLWSALKNTEQASGRVHVLLPPLSLPLLPCPHPQKQPSNNGNEWINRLFSQLSKGQFLEAFCTFNPGHCGIKTVWSTLAIFQTHPLCSLTPSSWDKLLLGNPN